MKSRKPKVICVYSSQGDAKTLLLDAFAAFLARWLRT